MKPIACVTAVFLSFIARPQAALPPQSVSELWDTYDARKAPLAAEVIKEWSTEEGTFRLVRYSLGTLEGTNRKATPIVAAYYGFPGTDKKVPAVLHIHGGGQRAEKGRVAYWVKLGYAAMSINWGGKVLEDEDTPNTDWDGLAAGFVASRDETHHNDVTPGPNTLYKEPHGFNSSWNLIAIAARRALTFLEQQPIVDARRLGVEGHSMGGRATVLTAIDRRVSAASPSVGGSGYLYREFWGVPGSGRKMQENLDLYERLVSAQSYWKHITCPTLFLGASNDFNSPTESVIEGMANLPASTDRRLALAPHLNHRFTTSTAAARTLWMESHLKETFEFPKQARAELVLDSASRIPCFKVWPESSGDATISTVDIYYGYARNPHIRFWRDAGAKRVGDHYEGACPVFDVDEPLFAFASITYTVNRKVAMPPGYDNPTDLLTVTSDYRFILPDHLKKAGAKATERPRRLIDDFSRGWHDWYQLNATNPQHWFFATRKIIDPSWVGPKDGKLALGIVTTRPGNKVAAVASVNDWQGYTGRKRDTFHVFIDLPQQGVNAIELATGDFVNEQGQTLKDWDELTEIGFQPAGKLESTVQNRKAEWKGEVPAFQNMHWVGGAYVRRPYPYQPRDQYGRDDSGGWSEKEVQDAVTDSDSVKFDMQTTANVAPSLSPAAEPHTFPPYFPPFSWDKVPVYQMFADNNRVLTDAEVTEIASTSDFICIEKNHGFTVLGGAELGTRHEARRFRTLNPELKCLFYFNSAFAYPLTTYSKIFRHGQVGEEYASFLIRDLKTGELADRGGVYFFDVLNPAFRTWWAETVGKGVRESGADGLFVDQMHGFAWLRPEKKKDVAKAQVQLMRMAKDAIGLEKILLLNNAADIPELFEIGDAFMFEHYHSKLLTKESIMKDWALMKKIAKAGRIAVWRIGVEVEDKDLPEAVNRRGVKGTAYEARAKQRLSFYLAAFLIGAQPYSYFQYGWGWTLRDGALAGYPELKKPLGKPMGAFTGSDSDKWIFRREFEHARVWLDLDAREGNIEWK